MTADSTALTTSSILRSVTSVFKGIDVISMSFYSHDRVHCA